MREYGFTLIELIVVIVVLSILAVGSVQFISFSAQGYVDSARRSQLASSATIINEKISRQVRDALPNSVRTNADQSCLEFIPVSAATYYVQAPFVDGTGLASQVSIVPLDNLLANSGYLSIYPVVTDVNSLYTLSAGSGHISDSVATVTAADTLSFSGGNFRFLQSSPQQRLFMVNQPQAFCQSGNDLFFYRNYGFVGDVSNLSALLPNSIPNRLILANNLRADSLRFSYLPSSLRRNAIVTFEFELEESGSDETLAVNQEVQVRNVP